MPAADGNPPNDGVSFAVFLSYNGDDCKEVEKLAVHLADRAHLEPWFDQWYIIPGESWVEHLERGLAASDSCAVFIGRGGQGPWQKPEVMAALRFQVSRPGFRVIPVLLPGATSEPELPVFLSGNSWVDFRGHALEDDDVLWKLECGVRGMPPLRGRPHAGTPAEPKEEAGVAAHHAAVAASAASVDIRQAARAASVFVSHCHQEPDRTLGLTLADALTKAGHTVFIDAGIRWGQDWVHEVSRHLELADYFLLLLSKESAASEMVAEELTIAGELSKSKGAPTILPLRVSLPLSEPLPYPVSLHLHRIRQEHWARPEDTARVVGCLLDAVGGGGTFR